MSVRRPELAVRGPALLGEGPVWDAARGLLLWVDILGSRIHTLDPATGARVSWTAAQHVGAALPRTRGGIVVNLRDGVGCYGPDGASFHWLHRRPLPGRRGNDAAVAPDGSLWAGTMAYDERPGGGTLTRYPGADAAPEVVFPEVTVSNGLGWSPDGRTMYYVDTPTRRIDALTVRPDGSATGRRPLITLEPGVGYPDGLTVDAAGCVWVALWDGGAVRRYTPSGALDRILPVPVGRPTSCAFGGRALRDLYVTTASLGARSAAEPLAGALLVVPDVGEGLPTTPFAG
ncbi:SMP-30/gluconolactonase/LRE family protein [Streptomyces sp. AJS327]|uniref:SMP-30/gluconolactonase/LRE family protein n=1 Tax=Streptomyces sp. AJS327 TaxID=2545265 RepID=UPI0015E0440F|nr:SMP-30/gluconolactonase/LRE family protein [Streptomyces sp. AJS327]MBA0052553.1 SMP-30/gluconolactonase/LRE family protein [Streptomyces sp. AJS327]